MGPAYVVAVFVVGGLMLAAVLVMGLRDRRRQLEREHEQRRQRGE